MNFVYKGAANFFVANFAVGNSTFVAEQTLRIVSGDQSFDIGDISDEETFEIEVIETGRSDFRPFADTIQYVTLEGGSEFGVALIFFSEVREEFYELPIRGQTPPIEPGQNNKEAEAAAGVRFIDLSFDGETGQPIFEGEFATDQPLDFADIEGLAFLGQSETSLLPGTDEDREARAQTVARLYEGALDRDGEIDEGGLNFWIDRAGEGLSDIDLAVAFTSAPEFVESFGDTGIDGLEEGAYVDLLYGNLLDREADEAGRNFWISVVETIDEEGFAPLGISADDSLLEKRAAFLLFFSEAPENQDNLTFIDDLDETLPGIWEFPV